MIKSVNVYKVSSTGPVHVNYYYVSVQPGQGLACVPQMTHHLAWDVFLRHTALVPGPSRPQPPSDLY